MELLERFPDGACFVALAPLREASLVVNTLAAALRVQESPNRPLLTTILNHLADKQLFLVLDNCEHVIAQVRRAAGALLRDCPGVSVLVTSREPLTMAGERVYRIPPLAVPSAEGVSPEEALTYGAVALLADRVQAADGRFRVVPQNVAAIVEICRRLDGLPLALELAAARATVLSPWQIAARLDRVFDLLAGNGSAELPRHQTMRAVIDWSYALLSTQARILFSRLAAFASGFTLETATAVCADDDLPADDVLESLSTLIAQSLVAADFSFDTARYHLLEVTRQYALERVVERGERAILAGRHALAFLEVAKRLDRDWSTAPERTWFEEAQAELDNFRQALKWSLAARHDLETGRALAAALARIWYSLSPLEGRRWVRIAIESLDVQTHPAIVAELHIAEARLCGALGEYAASHDAAERALRLGEALDDLQIARAREVFGSALSALGRAAEGETALHEALGTARRLENRALEALLLGDLGTARSRSGDIEAARSYYAEALARYMPLGLERPAASIAGHLAEVEFAAGDAAAALQRAEEARIGHEATHNRRSVANDLCNMAAYLIALDCFDDARSHATRALAAARDVKATVLTAFILQHFAAVGILQGASAAKTSDSTERAAMLMGFVDARLGALKAQREFTGRQEYDRVLAAIRDRFEEGALELAALGAHWNEEKAIAVALEL
ncbi:MAG: tetratricopeptide repeat protein [Candidatus Cybelea sp.]